MSDEGFPVGQSAIPNQYRPENLPCHGKYLYIDWHNREIYPHLEPRYICAPLNELSGFSWKISCDLPSCPVTHNTLPKQELAKTVTQAIELVEGSYNYDPRIHRITTIEELFRHG